MVISRATDLFASGVPNDGDWRGVKIRLRRYLDFDKMCANIMRNVSLPMLDMCGLKCRCIYFPSLAMSTATYLPTWSCLLLVPKVRMWAAIYRTIFDDSWAC